MQTTKLSLRYHPALSTDESYEKEVRYRLVESIKEYVALRREVGHHQYKIFEVDLGEDLGTCSIKTNID